MNYLKGLLSFVVDVEPEFKKRMICKYSLTIVDSIIRGNYEEE